MMQVDAAADDDDPDTDELEAGDDPVVPHPASTAPATTNTAAGFRAGGHGAVVRLNVPPSLVPANRGTAQPRIVVSPGIRSIALR
jgi:hypothetical protein